MAGAMSDYRSGGQERSPGYEAQRLGASLLEYLKTRSPEHWLFFAVGIIVGLIVS
jgi:hypothetical protein